MKGKHKICKYYIFYSSNDDFLSAVSECRPVGIADKVEM